MIDIIEFVGVIAICATILVWYAANDAADEDGRIGFLALKPDPLAKPEAAGGKRYWMKARGARRPGQSAGLDSASAYRQDEASARARFRRQDEARYFIKDRLSYKDKPTDEK